MAVLDPASCPLRPDQTSVTSSLLRAKGRSNQGIMSHCTVPAARRRRNVLELRMESSSCRSESVQVSENLHSPRDEALLASIAGGANDMVVPALV
jgi:hypothetical protein